MNSSAPLIYYLILRIQQEEKELKTWVSWEKWTCKLVRSKTWSLRLRAAKSRQSTLQAFLVFIAKYFILIIFRFLNKQSNDLQCTSLQHVPLNQRSSSPPKFPQPHDTFTYIYIYVKMERKIKWIVIVLIVEWFTCPTFIILDNRFVDLRDKRNRAC